MGISVLCVSGSHPGLFHPFLPLAVELAATPDVDVVFACTDDRKADLENAPGVRFESLGPAARGETPGSWSARTYARLDSPSRVAAYRATIEHLHAALLPTWLDRYEVLLGLAERYRPDVVVLDSQAGWGADAAISAGVPYVVNSALPVSYLFPRAMGWNHPAPMSGLPFGMGPGRQLANQLFKLLRVTAFASGPIRRAFAENVARRRRLGLPPNTGPAHYAAGARAVLGNSVFGIEYGFRRPPRTVRMVGPMLPPRGRADDRYGELFDWLDGSESVVYVALGTMMRPTGGQVRALVETARRLAPRHRLLWSLPRHRDALPAELPENLRVEEWVPQVEVLAHSAVRVFLTHGSNGSHHGLVFGKPLLVMPHSWDTRDQGMRYVHSGAALITGRASAVTADELVSGLTRLLSDPAYGHRARHWASRLRAAGGAAAAASVVLDQARTGS
ncbi:glycosyltransferase [Amycolatopsis suaedae]|uniref:Glycosyltransferase n=1 Tax=Amycolatopsis suaedae TaxID=2510978 RepID=A0A4Q7J9M6_9PSEU|nr:glycosyltransferase [Amycolatopsis suaedae]RZQ63939.1 glycosyltransferase [Amycolatopsis suaedae]